MKSIPQPLVAAYGLVAGAALFGAWCVVFAAIVVVDPAERQFFLKGGRK